MAVDWLRIKSEYISDRTASYRKLAKKYGVNKDSISIRARSEGWKELRDKQEDIIQTKTMQMAAEKVAGALSDEAALKARIRADLLFMVEDWISKQDAVEDTAAFRRMVQCCVDLGVLENAKEENEAGGVIVIPEVDAGND